MILIIAPASREGKKLPSPLGNQRKMNFLLGLGRLASKVQSGLTLMVLGVVWVLSMGGAILLGGLGALPGVAIASVASLVAGFVAALRLPDWLPQQSARLTRELTELRKQVEDSAREKSNLEGEIARLSTQRIRVEHYAPILGLNLVSMTGALRELDRRLLPTESLSESRYLGLKQVELRRELELLNVMQVRFKAHLGVDLQALRFHTQPDGTDVRVTGFRSQFQGVQEVQSTRELCTVLERIYELHDPGDGEGLRPGEEKHRSFRHDGQESMRRALELQEQLITQITRGLDLPHLDEAIQRMTMAFLQVIFAPLGLRLVFDQTGSDHHEQGLPLTSFLDHHNRRVDEQIQRLELQLTQKQQQMRHMLGADVS
jgi:hypothetical protein